MTLLKFKLDETNKVCHLGSPLKNAEHLAASVLTLYIVMSAFLESRERSLLSQTIDKIELQSDVTEPGE